MSGVGHIAHDPEHLVQTPVQPGHLFPGGGVIFQSRQGEESLGGDHDGAEGFPQFPGRQGHGLELPAVGQLFQAEKIKFIHPGDGCAERLSVQGQGQVQTAGFESFVLGFAGADQAIHRRSGGKTQTGRPGVDPGDLSAADAERRTAHEIQHSCGIVVVFHDDPPHGI